MARKSYTELMFEFVQEYISGDMPRMFFDLDFDHYFIKYYPAMERHNPDMAAFFAYYVSEQGIDVSHGLSDVQHKNSSVGSGRIFLTRSRMACGRFLLSLSRPDGRVF